MLVHWIPETNVCALQCRLSALRPKITWPKCVRHSNNRTVVPALMMTTPSPRLAPAQPQAARTSQQQQPAPRPGHSKPCLGMTTSLKMQTTAKLNSVSVSLASHPRTTHYSGERTMRDDTRNSVSWRIGLDFLIYLTNRWLYILGYTGNLCSSGESLFHGGLDHSPPHPPVPRARRYAHYF